MCFICYKELFGLHLAPWLLRRFFPRRGRGRSGMQAARLGGCERLPVLPLSHMGHFSALPGLQKTQRDHGQRVGQGPIPHPIP